MLKQLAMDLHSRYNQNPLLAETMASFINPISKLISIITYPFKNAIPKYAQRKIIGFDAKKLNAVQEKYKLYQRLITSQQDRHGFIYTDHCDATLFSGLISFANAYVDLKQARNPDGSWLRRPTCYEPCWYEGKGRSSTISRDMLLGVMWWIWAKKDLKTAEELFDYGRKHNWIMGKGDASRIYFTPALQATLAEIIYKLGGKNHKIYRNLPQNWPTGLKGYQMHLQMLHIELRCQLTGVITTDMLIAVNNNYSREPINALAQFLYAKYISGNTDKTCSLLLDKSLWPEDRLPTNQDRSTNWILSSQYYDDDGSINTDFLPDGKEDPKTHSGGDFLFVARLVLDLIRQ